MSKLGAIFFCLVFAIPFGAVGVGATWAIVSTIQDAMSARDWVKVKANVDPTENRYRYAFDGKEYSATRLGTLPIGGSSDVDDWDERVAGYLADARKSGKPIMVYVNPGNPAEALIDRDIRWKLLLFLSPFALVFGGVGVGALIAMIHVLRGKIPEQKAAAPRKPQLIASSGGGTVAFFWVFTLLWNAMSWPVAVLAVPQILQEENWVGLLVLLFPLIGLILLWSTLGMSFAALRLGKAELKLHTEKPRLGATLQGTVLFEKRFAPGTLMRVRLVCQRVEDDSDGVSTRPHWHKEQDLPLVDAPQGSQATFRFDIPADVPATSAPSTSRKVSYRWRLDAHPAKQLMGIAQSFEIEVQAATAGAFARAQEASVAPDTPAFPTIEGLLGAMNARTDR